MKSLGALAICLFALSLLDCVSPAQRTDTDAERDAVRLRKAISRNIATIFPPFYIR